jgi:hypothetical protein
MDLGGRGQSTDNPGGGAAPKQATLQDIEAQDIGLRQGAAYMRNRRALLRQQYEATQGQPQRV